MHTCRIIPVLLVFALFLIPASATTEPGNQWITRNALPGAIYGGAMFNWTDAIYYVGGQNSAINPVATVYKSTDGLTWATQNASALIMTSGVYGLTRSAYTTWDGKMWILGGLNSSTQLTDSNMTLYSTNGDVWWASNLSTRFPPREDAAAVNFTGRIWMAGGWNQKLDTKYNDTWWLDTTNESKGIWTRATSAAPWVARHGHTMAVFGGRMWVIGGNYSGAAGDVWSTSDGVTWTQDVVGNVALNRSGMASAVTKNGTLVVSGGYSYVMMANEDEVDMSVDGTNWIIVNTTPAPTARMYSRMVPFTPTALTTELRSYEGLYLAGGFAGGVAVSSTYVSLAPPDASADPDSTTGTAPLAVAWMDTSAGYATSWTWDFRDGYFSYEQNASHIFTSSGTYNVTFTPLSTFGSTIFSSLVSVSTQQSQIMYYTQKQVRIRVVDRYGVPIIGANVTATYINTSLPTTNTTWLISAFGVSPAVAAEMLNGGLGMIALTGNDGAVNFMMFPSLKYGLNITNASMGLNHYTSLYPQDTDYTIYAILSAQATQNGTIPKLGNTSLWVTFPDAYHVTFCMGYRDSSTLTQNVSISVWKWRNITTNDLGLPLLMYTYIFNDTYATYVQDCNYTAENIRGDEYKFAWNASRTALW